MNGIIHTLTLYLEMLAVLHESKGDGEGKAKPPIKPAMPKQVTFEEPSTKQTC